MNLQQSNIGKFTLHIFMQIHRIHRKINVHSGSVLTKNIGYFYVNI